MVDDPRPPVAIRITRPQTTEDEFLEQELDTVSRASVTLLGAQPRPQGVVLRFELVLASGYVLMRGEGRVVGFRPNAHQGLGGLTLRFTRLDSRSKALVDKAAALRDRRRPSALPPPPAPAPEAATPAAAAAPPPLDLESTHAEIPSAKRSERPAPPAAPHDGAPQPVAPVAPAPPAPRPAGPRAPARAADAPPGRDALLERLRGRAKTLDGAAVQRILEQRRRP